MDNEKACFLLKTAPKELIASDYFQNSISKVLNRLIGKGVIKRQEKEDFTQELNIAFIQKKIFDVQRNFQSSYGSLGPYIEMSIYRKALDIAKNEKQKKSLFSEQVQAIDFVGSESISTENTEFIINELKRLEIYFQLFHDKKPKLILLLKLFARICLENKDLKNYYLFVSDGMTIDLLLIFGVPYYEKLDKEIYQEILPLIQLAEKKSLTADALRKWINDRISEIIKALNSGRFIYDKESVRNLMQFHFRKFNVNHFQIN
ncbi:MAG: hypothetical protein AAFQ94_14315 [Bacteroidota bacterium]